MPSGPKEEGKLENSEPREQAKLGSSGNMPRSPDTLGCAMPSETLTLGHRFRGNRFNLVVQVGG